MYTVSFILPVLLALFAFVQVHCEESFSLPTKSENISYSYGNVTKQIIETGTSLLTFTFSSFDPKDPQFELKVNNETIKIHYNPSNGVSKMPSYNFEKKDNSFYTYVTIDNEKADPGLYELSVVDASSEVKSTITVESPPILPQVQKPKRVLEGDQLRLKCNAKAFPKCDGYVWEFGYMNQEDGDAEEIQIAATQNFTKINDVTESNISFNEDGSELTIKSLQKEDNGLYRCTAKNALGSDREIYFVNVKNRWAALWPFIGIVIEVAVLVSAILIYEHHSMRSKSQTVVNNNDDQSHNNVTAINNLETVPEVKDVRERVAPKI